jgi:hypothetical protein
MAILIDPDQGNGRDPQDEKEEDREGNGLLDLAKDRLDVFRRVPNADDTHGVPFEGEGFGPFKDILFLRS